MTLQVLDVEQGTPEWFEARAGIPTASEFSTVMSEGRADGTMPNAMIDALVKEGATAAVLAAAVKAAKAKNSNPAAMRAKYLDKLAGEIITGEPDPDSYSNAHLERGKEMEAEARAWYALTYEPVQRVGFIRSGRAGASPDSLVGANGGLEIKTAMPTVHLPRLRSGKLPSEHKAQVQGNLWIAEREWWDFVSYWPKLPPLVIRVYRDEEYIAKLAAAVDAFNADLDNLVSSIRGVEQFRSAA
jgi:hypothetical protein